jgi:Ran-binding protein 1
MKLQPNIGSDRSWVYKVHADYSETPPTSETLAIRFGNADSMQTTRTFDLHRFTYSSDANAFKEAFESAQKTNVELGGASEPTADSKAEETKAEAASESAPAKSETKPEAEADKKENSTTEVPATATKVEAAAEEDKKVSGDN